MNLKKEAIVQFALKVRSENGCWIVWGESPSRTMGVCFGAIHLIKYYFIFLFIFPHMSLLLTKKKYKKAKT